MLTDVALNVVDSYSEAERFTRWLREPRDRIGVDTETGGLEWWREPLRTVQFGDDHTGWCVPVESPHGWPGLVTEAFRTIQRTPTVWQNLKFDAHFLQRDGYPLELGEAHDTRVMAHLWDNDGPTGLKSVAAQHVDPRASLLGAALDSTMKANGWTWRTVPVTHPDYWAYAAADPVLTVRVSRALQPKVDTEWRHAYEIELACQLALLEMETRGLQVDRDYCTRAQARMRRRQSELADEVKTRYDVEPAKIKQVIARLQEEGVVLTKRTDKGNLSLDEEVLSEIEHPLAAAVLEYRHLDKIATTYLDNFLTLSDDQGRLHPTMNLLGAKTGRMSVSSPSLQNLERSPDVRDAIIPSPGNVLLLVDYDQIELRLLAHYAQERRMLEAINAGHDLHTEMCRRIFDIADDQPVPRESRTLTKNGTFAILYGAGIGKFAKTVGVGYRDAEAFMNSYDREFPSVRAFQQFVIERGRERVATEGSAYVTTWLGRRLRVADDKLYRLVNYLIQGVAAEVLKHQLVQLHLADLTQYLVLPVHDEFVFDVPRGELDDYRAAVLDVIQLPDTFSVPLTAGTEVVERWGDKYRKEAT